MKQEDTRMKIDLSQNSPEVRAALIQAVAHVYAAGLEAAGSSSDDIRRQCAREDVDNFLEKLQSLS